GPTSDKGSSVIPETVDITPEKTEQVHDILKENLANLDLPAEVDASTVDVLTLTSDAVEVGEKRSTSDLNDTQKAAVSDDNKVPAAVLPKMKPIRTGIFCFKVTLDSSIPEDATLEWHPFPQETNSGSVSTASVQLAVDGDKTAVFMKNGQTITTVPSDHEVEVAAYMEAGVTYEPVIAAVTSSNPDSPTSNKGSGGCDALSSGLALLALIPLFMRKRS
ncbi:MAG: SYNERG-CTERM sorting domain-containing protein, partial [Fretibacterium sp.]|nr:SYNERG-CTERM sorting domain-containing protein [Fretibacterium sp.]